MNLPPLRARSHLGKNLSWTLKLEWAWMKPILGRISMCFLISGHTSKVSFKAVLALLGKSVVGLAKQWRPIPFFITAELL